MKRIVIVARWLVLAWLAFGVLTACAGQKAGTGSIFETAKVETGDLEANVIATGSVRPARSAVLSWQIAGAVQTVSAKEMSQVSGGDTLVSLQRASLPQNVILAESDMADAQKTLEDLQNSATASAQAHADLVQAQKAYDDAKHKRDALNPNRRAGEAQINAAKADLIFAEQDLRKKQEKYDELAHRSENDPYRAIALADLAAAQKTRDRAQINVNYLTGKPGLVEISEADSNMALAKAKLDDAQRAYDRLRDGAPAADLRAAQARIDAAQATLAMAELHAPFSGTIVECSLQPGDLVSAGQNAIRLEDHSHLFVDVKVSEIDVNRLQAGQPVSLTLDAVYGKTYRGKVTQVGVSGARDQGMVTFPVVIEIQDPDEAVKSGMTAAVSIQVEQVKKALLVPNRAVRILDGKRVVYIQDANGLPQPVEITLGVSNDTLSQVLKGDLKAGDTLVVNPEVIQNGQGSISVGGT